MALSRVPARQGEGRRTAWPPAVPVRVRPLYPASASRPVFVNTGTPGARAADGVVVRIGHLPVRLRPGGWASQGWPWQANVDLDV